MDFTRAVGHVINIMTYEVSISDTMNVSIRHRSYKVIEEMVKKTSFFIWELAEKYCSPS